MEHKPYFRNRPSSPIAILMIHGILGTPRHFDWLIDQIPDEITVHNILLKGHGGSVRDFSDATMSDWKAQVEQALMALENPGRRILIVGHSLGTLLAMDAAVRHPCVRGLLLLNPPLQVQFRPRLLGMTLRSAFGILQPDTPLHAAYLSACGTHTEPQLWKYFGWLPNFVSLLKLCRKSRKLPCRISVPCHVYLGKDDDLVHINSQKWFRQNPQITLTILPEGIHFGYANDERIRIQNSLSSLLNTE